MNTLTERWSQYRGNVYPKGLPAEFAEQLAMAYFAGSLHALSLAIEDTAEMPPAAAQHCVFDLIMEAKTTCQAFARGEKPIPL